ncbi:XkdF-like putative serine protease domain-containing protein [Silvanigrella sp.]|jgi:uncharacterized protein Veg|uniref:XkdF-like putative serine protease domain-containing protein n=1 Tax=Silvanigrella sp. TaxID=2024976 RepID=UPI0037CAFBFA
MNKFEIISKSYKFNKDYKTITGLILQPDLPDLHGDILSKEEVKKACYNYMKKKQLQTGKQHVISDDIALVECYISKSDINIGDQVIKEGSWFGEFEPLNDKIKEEIEQEKFKGFSVKGTALTELLQQENIQKSKENPYINNPKRRLSDVDVFEISIVDQPANNVQIIEFNKSLDGENKKMTIKIEDIKKEVATNLTLLEEIKKEFGEKKEQTKEDIIKSASPELAFIIKQNEDMLAKYEKEKTETIRKEFQTKVSDLKKYTPAEDNLIDALMAVSKNNPEQFKIIEQTLNSAVDTIKKSANFVPFGEDNPEDKTTNTPQSKTEIIAKSYMDKDSNLTKEKAVAKAIKQNARR